MAVKTIYPPISVGDRFSRWRVESEASPRRSPSGDTKRYWNCVCICNSRKEVAATSLKAGLSHSCGCLQAEVTAARCFRHGDANRLTKTREYETWRNMWSRCTDPLNGRYKDYGGRGIMVCESWKSFEQFLLDMGRRPTPRHSIDRIENDLGYGPENCRWATRLEQSNHTRATRWVDYNGRKISVADLARLLGVPYDRLYMRLHAGWDVERAVRP